MNPTVYIRPDTTVDICRGVPLPQNYEHVCTFASAAAAYTAFAPYIKYSRADYTPVRYPNAISVPYSFGALSDCNYLIFTAGSNRIYCFITDIKYINDAMSLVSYTVDIWTTNYPKMSFGRCYVEREHVNDDTFGLHTIPEGLETGDFVNNTQFMELFNYDNQNTCILYTPLEVEELRGALINGVFSGLNISTITTKSVGPIELEINRITENGKYPERIIAIYHYPRFMGTVEEPTITGGETVLKKPDNLNGYIPKNNKCFTGEFCYILGDDLNGSTNAFYYELSNEEDFSVKFKTVGTFATQPVINTYPINYKGMFNCYMDGFTHTNFPYCSWSSNAFASWWAQNKNAMGAQTIGSALNVASGALIGFATGGVKGAALSAASGSIGALNTAIGQTAAIKTAQQQPAQVHGQTQTDSLNTATSRNATIFYAMSIKAEYAETIDNFFEVFGYRVNKLKVPNITGRPYWNFVKTSNAVINGNLYMDTTGAVESILNRGVTIWHQLSNIGNYNLNNH